MSAFSETKTAPTKWAQRTDTLYVTLSIPDVKNETLDVTEKGISFKASSNGEFLRLLSRIFNRDLLLNLSAMVSNDLSLLSLLFDAPDDPCLLLN